MKPVPEEHVNRTGMKLAPRLAAELMSGTELTAPSSLGDAELLSKVRVAYAKESEPVGTAAPSTEADDETGMLVDKLGERLAFERSSTRLYESLLSKLDAYGSWPGGPAREDLVHIRDEEREHFTLLTEAIASLGGDPTEVTPSADVAAEAGKGILAVVADPRVDLRQSMEAVLNAELMDNEAWENLIDLSVALDQPQLAERFEEALEEEREHLEKLRHWLGAALSRAFSRHAPFEQREQERLERFIPREAAPEPAVTAPGRTPPQRRTPPDRPSSKATPKKKKEAAARSSQSRGKVAPKKKRRGGR